MSAPATVPYPSGVAAIRPITEREFRHFQRLIFDAVGISLCPAKKLMVSSRLQKRLAHYGLRHYIDYYRLLTDGSHMPEFQVFVDLLTTNETYFFREPAHFEYLGVLAGASRNSVPYRVWSAASSSGEEAYSLAMVLADKRGGCPWEVIGSDVSERVLKQARNGHYPMERNDGIGVDYLKRYCLKGVRSQANTFLVDRPVRDRVSFRHINLTRPLPPNLGLFDVVFLRNVLIYFDQATKQQIAGRVVKQIKPGGYLFISHTESLHGMVPELEAVRPSIFRRS